MQHEKRAFRTLRLLTHCESDTFFIAQTRIYIFASNIFKFIAIRFFFFAHQTRDSARNFLRIHLEFRDVLN